MICKPHEEKMIIWTCMRTGGTVLINHLTINDTQWRKKLPSEFPELGLTKGEYGKIWNYEHLNPNNPGQWNNWIDAVTKYNLYTKIYNRPWPDSFYKTISSANQNHVILYRENSFDRLLSHWFRTECLSLDKKSIDLKPIDVHLCIRWEHSARTHFAKVVETVADYQAISYEDIFIRKDLEKMDKVFPGIDHSLLVKSERYDYWPLYERMENYQELREEVSKLPTFHF